MPRRLLALPLAACIPLFGACGDDQPADREAADVTGRALGTSAMAGEGDSPAFALVRGQDTLLVERYTLEADRVSGVMRDPSGSSVEYEAVHGIRGADRSLRIVVRPSGPGAGAPVTSSFTMSGDSVVLEQVRGDSTSRQTEAVPADALPYLSPSMGMMALLVRSARDLVGDSGHVTLLAASLSQNPVIVEPLIMWSADTAWVIGDQLNRFRLVFSEGRLLSVENAPQQIRSVRLPGGTGAGAAATPPASETGETPAASGP